jgi:hypothetical protein
MAMAQESDAHLKIVKKWLKPRIPRIVKRSEPFQLTLKKKERKMKHRINHLKEFMKENV